MTRTKSKAQEARTGGRHKKSIPKPPISSRKLIELCERYGIRRLWLYGSILGSRFRLDSDVDVLVETDRAHPVGLFKLGGFQADLVSMMRRPVHLTTLARVPATPRESR